MAVSYGPKIRTIGGPTRMPLANGTHNFVREYYGSKATSGKDVRAHYVDVYHNSTGSGDTLRIRGIANGTGVATGGTITAIHATGRVASGKTVSGALAAVRATLEVAGTTPTPGGTLAALQLDVNASATTTWGTPDAYVRVTNSGSTALKNLFNFTEAAGSASATTLVTTSADKAATHMIRCQVNGATVWLLATTNTPS